ncbi:hypothetical protein HYQ45_005489 [Verticillium longisporum]|uniref:Uncharacterized protein n=1 Tax=Verticillium longisporum TaxID=100787 RepID=A0A8I2ZT43_VERLO|nr:hypothetical protein HYQ45_005489 [Verticillium longisporum]
MNTRLHDYPPITAMASTSTYRQHQPVSPAWSHSSLASDVTVESFKAESFSSAEGSPDWPSPKISGFRAFSHNTGERLLSLPRLPELDLISLETLASHYARSSADSRLNNNDSLTRRPRLDVDAASTYRRHFQPPTPLSPMSSPHRIQKPKRNPPARGTRCNVKYTIEQKDFIDYWRIDRHDRETPWDDVNREYNAQFKGPLRRNGGLQSAYYRENKKIPVTDAQGLLVFDEFGEVKTIELPVRDAKARLIKSIGLLSTHPERAIHYSWVSKEHKRKVWRIGHERQAQLDASMQRQRRRAEMEARLARGQEQHSAPVADDCAVRSRL